MLRFISPVMAGESEPIVFNGVCDKTSL